MVVLLLVGVEWVNQAAAANNLNWRSLLISGVLRRVIRAGHLKVDCCNDGALIDCFHWPGHNWED